MLPREGGGSTSVNAIINELEDLDLGAGRVGNVNIWENLDGSQKTYVANYIWGYQQRNNGRMPRTSTVVNEIEARFPDAFGAAID